MSDFSKFWPCLKKFIFSIFISGKNFFVNKTLKFQIHYFTYLPDFVQQASSYLSNIQLRYLASLPDFLSIKCPATSQGFKCITSRPYLLFCPLNIRLLPSFLKSRNTPLHSTPRTSKSCPPVCAPLVYHQFRKFPPKSFAPKLFPIISGCGRQLSPVHFYPTPLNSTANSTADFQQLGPNESSDPLVCQAVIRPETKCSNLLVSATFFDFSWPLLVVYRSVQTCSMDPASSANVRSSFV